MVGKSISEFIDELYSNPEMEFVYKNERYMISGYLTDNLYTLEMCNITNNNVVFKKTSYSRMDCITAFEEANIFNGENIYQVEEKIEILYG